MISLCYMNSQVADNSSCVVLQDLKEQWLTVQHLNFKLFSIMNKDSLSCRDSFKNSIDLHLVLYVRIHKPDLLHPNLDIWGLYPARHHFLHTLSAQNQ